MNMAVEPTHSLQAQEIPWNAPTLPPHYLLGAPTITFRYGQSFVVAKFKDHSAQLTWAGRWVWKQYPAPRPVYHYDSLIKRPDAPVLILDDEECADIARVFLPAYASISWAGGQHCLMENDWSVLKDRDVLVWPNAKLYHVELLAYLTLIAKRVRVIDASDQVFGWNIEAAYRAEWSAAQIIAWASEHVIDAQDHRPQQPKADPIDSILAPAQWDRVRQTNWRVQGLDTNRLGIPYATTANASLLLQLQHAYLWFDTFTGRICHRVNGVDRIWTRRDTQDLSVLIQQRLKLPKFDEQLIGRAVEHAARQFPKHSLQAWLKSLVWDKQSRLNHWLTDAAGVLPTPYSNAVGANFLTAMVARAFDPGCEFPHLLVFLGGESPQKVIAALAGQWYKNLPVKYSEEQLRQALQGSWLVELPALETFTRRGRQGLLSTCSSRNDVYRESKAQGSVPVDHPRVALLAAPTAVEYAHLPFWMVRCSQLDLEALERQRDQLFAEAMVAYQGRANFLTAPPRNTAIEAQADPNDEWTAPILDHCQRVWEEWERTRVRNYITTSRILKDVCGLYPSQQTQAHRLRVGNIMRSAGWIYARDALSRYWKKPRRRL